MQIVPFTNLSGTVWDPAFSPDAKQVAFFWNGGNPGKGDLYVQLIGGEAPLRLTHTNSGSGNSPAWSSDGTEIAFGRCDDNGGGVYVVPALGGPERKVAEVACPYGMAGHPQWTSDGKSMVFQDHCTPGGALSIVVFSMETGKKRCLTNPPFGQEQGDFIASLSPDQQTVAFLRWPTAGVDDIFTVPLAGGEPHRLTTDNKAIGSIMWSADGSSISFTSNRGGLMRNWRVSMPDGAIEPETVYPGIGSLSRDGSKLAFVEPPDTWIGSSEIWRADLLGAGGTVSGVRRLQSAGSSDVAPQISPDEREIAFESSRSGSVEIWKCNADGSNPLKLTSLGGYAGTPRWSPDGKWIAFDFRPSAHSQIFLLDEQGRNLHMISSGKGEYENVVPSWSRDQKSIYFASNRTGSYQIWRYDLATGRETRLTDNGGFAAFESYDGTTLYFSKFQKVGIWRVSLAGGAEERILNVPHVSHWGDFAVTEAGIYVIDSDAEPGPAILYYSFATRRLVHTLSFNEGFAPISLTSNLGASRDGRTVFFAQGTSKSSIVIADNLR
jgi:Tol biopolymer transport system component